MAFPKILAFLAVALHFGNAFQTHIFMKKDPFQAFPCNKHHHSRSTPPCSPVALPMALEQAVVELETVTTSTGTSLFSVLLNQLDLFWQTSPYTAAALVCGVKASAADMVAQQATAAPLPDLNQDDTLVAASTVSFTDDNHESAVNVDIDIDVRRNMAFVLYGALYQGMVHEYVFNHLYPAWFGTGTTPEIVLVKVAFNLLVQTTLVTLPVAYILKAIIMNDHDETEDNNNNNNNAAINNNNLSLQQLQSQLQHQIQQPFQLALEKYWNDIQHQNLLGTCFGLWGPVQCLTFSVVPEHYRVTFIAVVSFFWLIILSQISNAEATDTDSETLTTAK